MTEGNSTQETTPTDTDAEALTRPAARRGADPATVALLRLWGWPAWFTALASFALTTWIVGDAVLFLGSGVGISLAGGVPASQYAEHLRWVGGGLSVAVALLAGILCLAPTLTAFRRMSEASPSGGGEAGATAGDLLERAGRPAWLARALVPVGGVAFAVAALLAFALLYFALTIGAVIPEAVSFVAAYVLFLSALTLASLAGGVSLVTAARAFRTMQDAAKETPGTSPRKTEEKAA